MRAPCIVAHLLCFSPQQSRQARIELPDARFSATPPECLYQGPLGAGWRPPMTHGCALVMDETQAPTT